MTPFVLVVAGLSCWTLLEYLLHRFVFHERVLGAAMSREHARHHGRVKWFAPWSSKVKLAVLVLPPIGAATALLGGLSGVGLLVGVPFIAGIAAGWLAYEWFHRRIHTHPPVGPYGRWARRHHLSHHLEDPTRNHGVTSPVWDHVFGTLGPSAVVTVPRAHLSRFPWMLGDGGTTIAPRWASSYRVRT